MKTQATKSNAHRVRQSPILSRFLLTEEKRREANEGACVSSEETGLLAIGNIRITIPQTNIICAWALVLVKLA